MGGGELRVFLLCHLATPLSTFFKWTAANTGSWERGLCGGDWLSGWETCSLRSVKTEHRAVVLGPGLCCRGSDTLYLPPFPAFGGNQNLLCSGIRKRKGPAAVARMSLRFPGGTTVSSYPSSRFQSCRISIRFFLMT